MMKKMPGDIRASTISYYDRAANEYAARTQSLDLSEQYSRFLEHLPTRASILDAGCGSGRDVKAFADRGYVVVGIDASKELVRRAKEYSGQPCFVTSFGEVEWDEEFDGIWACASLLHVPKREIADILERLCRALKPNGIMYVSLREGIDERNLPDGRYFANYLPSEFKHIADGTSGLRVIDYWRNRDLDPTRDDVWWLNFLLKRVAS